MDLQIEFEIEDDGRWIAEILGIPGVMAYGTTREEAKASVEALALRVIADRIEAEKPEQTGLFSPTHEFQLAEF